MFSLKSLIFNNQFHLISYFLIEKAFTTSEFLLCAWIFFLQVKSLLLHHYPNAHLIFRTSVYYFIESNKHSMNSLRKTFSAQQHLKTAIVRLKYLPSRKLFDVLRSKAIRFIQHPIQLSHQFRAVTLLLLIHLYAILYNQFHFILHSFNIRKHFRQKPATLLILNAAA